MGGGTGRAVGMDDVKDIGESVTRGGDLVRGIVERVRYIGEILVSWPWGMGDSVTKIGSMGPDSPSASGELKLATQLFSAGEGWEAVPIDTRRVSLKTLCTIAGPTEGGA